MLSVLAVLAVSGNPSGWADPLPWAPPPVNGCGEVGFDPQARQPDPHAPPAPPAPIRITYPAPRFMEVPAPGPLPDNTRVDMTLPTDVCRNPCPELADGAEFGTPRPATSPPPPVGFQLPQIVPAPQDEPIPVVITALPPDNSRPQQHPPTPEHPSAEPDTLAPAPPAPTVKEVHPVSQITGPGSQNRTNMRWQVTGTDLGLMWESKPGQVAVMFGDTFGGSWQPGEVPNKTNQWRSNVLGFSSDRDLAHGLKIDRMVTDKQCHAAELLQSRKIRNFEETVIPTSGFALGNRQYVSYMSVRRWSYIPGMWWTNYGGLAWSDDDGQTWTKSDFARWDELLGVGEFQVAAMVPHGAYVYMFGTPNGRIGTIALARVPTSQLLNKSAYQYWNNGTWAPSPGIQLVPRGLTGQTVASPIVSGISAELSVRYNEDAHRWEMSYLDPLTSAIVLRVAETPQGAWSDEAPLIHTADYPQAYGGFIHPWSTAKDLYFTVSEWNPYNVFLMHATLD